MGGKKREQGLQCHKRSLHGHAARSSALGAGGRNAVTKGRLDCWGVQISLYVDGGRSDERLHLGDRKYKQIYNLSRLSNLKHAHVY